MLEPIKLMVMFSRLDPSRTPVLWPLPEVKSKPRHHCRNTKRPQPSPTPRGQPKNLGWFWLPPAKGSH